MKLLAHIEVEKVNLPGGAYTFRSELVEVEVLRVIRSPAGHDRKPPYKVRGWHYRADIAEHPKLAPEAYRSGGTENYYRVLIPRALNPGWKPPVFPEGRDWVAVEASQS